MSQAYKWILYVVLVGASPFIYGYFMFGWSYIYLSVGEIVSGTNKIIIYTVLGLAHLTGVFLLAISFAVSIKYYLKKNVVLFTTLIGVAITIFNILNWLIYIPQLPDLLGIVNEWLLVIPGFLIIGILFKGKSALVNKVHA